jgi:hypothetical protein
MRRGSEGEDCLIKDNMPGDDDVVGGEIETLISFVVSEVSEEDTTSGPGGQFVSSLCGEVGIADAAKHTQVLIRGCDAVEGNKQAGDTNRFTREVI